MRRLAIMLFLIPHLATAGFEGLPLSDDFAWEFRTNNPFAMIYSGIVERATVAGIAAPNIVEDWICSDGYTNQLVPYTGGTYTNKMLRTKTVRTTNQFDTFTYSLTDGGSATGYPFVTLNMITALDSTIEALIPKFISFNLATNQVGYHSNAYTSDWTYVNTSGDTNVNDDVTIYPTVSIPFESKENLFLQYDIGIVQEPETNIYGIVTNGTARWTRQPDYTNEWLLVSYAYVTNGWSKQYSSTMDAYLYETNYPEMKYTITGTNPFSGSVSVGVEGSYRDFITQSNTVTGSNTVTLTSTNWTAATDPWYTVSALTPDTFFNTNDYIVLKYRTGFALQNDLLPSILYGSYINERYEALKRLIYTKETGSFNGIAEVRYGSAPDASLATLNAAVTSNELAWATNGFIGVFPTPYTLDPFQAAVAVYDYITPVRLYFVDSENYIYATNIESTAIATNVPYTWNYFGWARELEYGMDANQTTDQYHAEKFQDWSGLTLAPDTADGNKFNYYWSESSPQSTPTAIYTDFYDTILSDIEDNRASDADFPEGDGVHELNSDSTNNVSVLWEYFSLNTKLHYGSPPSGSVAADAVGWFYIKHDFEYK